MRARAPRPGPHRPDNTTASVIIFSHLRKVHCAALSIMKPGEAGSTYKLDDKIALDHRLEDRDGIRTVV